MGVKERIISYALATRPWSLTASLLPALLGSILAFKDFGKVDLPLCALTLLSVMFTHLGANLSNTYFDFTNGVDTELSDDRTLVDHVLTPDNVINLMVVSYTSSLVTFLLVLLFRPNTDSIYYVYLILVFGSGCLLSFLYTGGIALKYHALGDFVICWTFGPLVACFTYITHASGATTLPWRPMFFSLPLVLITEAILHENNVRDCKEDAKCGVVTLPILLGENVSYHLCNILLVLPFIYLLYVVYALSFWFVLPCLSIPRALTLYKMVGAHDLRFVPQETAKFHSVFGLLYIVALFFS